MEEESSPDLWSKIPDSILLHIFSYLNAKSLLRSAQICGSWLRVAYDESLWKALVQNTWRFTYPLAPGKTLWKNEYKRLSYHSPVVESETLTDHKDEVLHVSFSHNGEMFATTSKDATVKVWNVGYPTQKKFSENMRAHLNWDFTQYSSFNETDNMLLVSGVKITSQNDRRGYLAVLSLDCDFDTVCVVTMDPSQLFGAWLDEKTFLGGSLELNLNRFTTSVEIEAFQLKPAMVDPITYPDQLSNDLLDGLSLFTFTSETASLIKFLTIANVPVQKAVSNPVEPAQEAEQEMETPEPEENNMDFAGTNLHRSYCNEQTNSSENLQNSSVYGFNLKNNIEVKKRTIQLSTGEPAHKRNAVCKRYLVFVTGEFSVALHQIGLKDLPSTVLDVSGEMIVKHPLEEDLHIGTDMIVNYSNHNVLIRAERSVPDKVDHLIDLYGHITGLCLSNDNRYLYVNCRPWVGKVDRSDIWSTPDLSVNIEIRVLDLQTLQDTGIRYIGHLGLSPAIRCCFVFLDVSEDYVASGSEDRKGYLWDRHYTTCLTSFEHGPGVVNAVAFNPKDQEYLITVSDDHTIKVWRSKHCLQELNNWPPRQCASQ